MQDRLFGVLVTYRRPVELSDTLRRLADQHRALDRLVVVDNAPSEETRSIVMAAAAGFDRVDYLPMDENLGFPGGVAAGMEAVLDFADDSDWIVVLDDDDPPHSPDTFAELHRFASEMVHADPRTGGVAFGGGRYEARRGRMIRVPTSELQGPVALDFLAGNFFGCYRVAAVREQGPWMPDIFFEFDELEYGLRLRRAGFSLYADGDVWRARREAAGFADYVSKPQWRVDDAGWRRYYAVRNQIHIVRRYSSWWAAARLTFLVGVAKPLANLIVDPKKAVGNLRLTLKASADAWRGRMGRRVEPVPWGPRPVTRTRSGERVRTHS